ncbi:hypothetical protein, partial [uncultured Micrococcus sp.]|uniref:hypothetical protein n=1 Tax=uncultured Micrococcus sp. TaxID=114051 RepID=UPI00259AEA0E
MSARSSAGLRLAVVAMLIAVVGAIALAVHSASPGGSELGPQIRIGSSTSDESAEPSSSAESGSTSSRPTPSDRASSSSASSASGSSSSASGASSPAE